MPTLEVIQEKLKKLQAQADVLMAKKAQSALDQIRGLMLEHGLTIDDIEVVKAKADQGSKAANTSGVGAKRKASSALGTKVAPKFQDPKSGATWTGRGSAPAWIAKAKDRTRFLIQSNTGVADRTETPKAKNAKAIPADERRGYRTGPQPAKYRDRKSGATWSGKGRAPAWLANVKDRTKFLIDEEGGPSDAEVLVKAARKAPAKNASASKKVPRKVAPKKRAANNPVAKKGSAVSRAAKESTLTKSASAGKTVAVKKSGPVAKKRASRKATVTSDAAKASTVADATSDTQASVEAPVL